MSVDEGAVEREAVVSVNDTADRVSCVLVRTRVGRERGHDFGTRHQPATYGEGHAPTVQALGAGDQDYLPESPNNRLFDRC